VYSPTLGVVEFTDIKLIQGLKPPLVIHAGKVVNSYSLMPLNKEPVSNV
jgi:hypothetical protein